MGTIPVEQRNVTLSPGRNGGSPGVAAGCAVVSPHRTDVVMSLQPSEVIRIENFLDL